MAANSATGLLTSVDSMFTTLEERDNAQRSYLIDIPAQEISDFPNHPFHVRMDAGTGPADAGEGENYGIAPLLSLQENAAALSDSLPSVIARAVDADYADMLERSDGYLTAWMLYWLQSDQETGSVFFGDDPELLNNLLWQDVAIVGCTSRHETGTAMACPGLAEITNAALRGGNGHSACPERFKAGARHQEHPRIS